MIKIKEVNHEYVYDAPNSDDTTKAVLGLDIFTKNWCLNCELTEKGNEPVFRCHDCGFEDPETSICMIKHFAMSHKHNYPMENFGAMIPKRRDSNG